MEYLILGLFAVVCVLFGIGMSILISRATKKKPQAEVYLLNWGDDEETHIWRK